MHGVTGPRRESHSTDPQPQGMHGVTDPTEEFTRSGTYPGVDKTGLNDGSQLSNPADEYDDPRPSAGHGDDVHPASAPEQKHVYPSPRVTGPDPSVTRVPR
jgi:hypothetical protein